MPPFPGEERLLTLFVDAHYYFTAPSPHPLHHRFDKGSYLYIYHNPSLGGARIEIANNAGTREQDAFCGSLSTSSLRTSDTFPTLFTLTVDGYRRSGQSSSSAQGSSENDWRLAWTNPADRNTSFLRLHTLDLYFWTSEDAKLFLVTVKELLAPGQLENIQQEQPAPSQQAPMSSVVQNLENVAISDANHEHSKADSRSFQNDIPPPPPPPPANSALSAMPANVEVVTQPVSPIEEMVPRDPSSLKKEEKTETFSPLPYNPAAPAAPEHIKPREITPPPPDAATGTGLTKVNNGMSFGPPSTGSIESPQPIQPYGAVNGNMQAYNLPGTYSPSPLGLQRQPFTPGHPPSGGLSYGLPPSSSGALPVRTASQHGSANMSFSAPPQDPNAHLYGQQSYGSPPVTSYTQPQAPYPAQITRRESQASQHSAGGYVTHPYNQQQQQQQQPQPQAALQNEYSIHHQVYVPTGSATAPPPAQKPGKAEARLGKVGSSATRMESGVNRLLKKLESKSTRL